MDKKEKKQSIFKDASTYFIIIVFIILIRTFVITPIRVNGNSMYQTLEDKEIMLLDKITYRFTGLKRFDIVVIDYKNERTDYSEKLIKRIIGLPGETVEYKDDILYINGEVVEEYFKVESTKDFNISTLGYDKVPDDCYFVLGDNRDNSTDSRVLGCIPKEEITGKANLVIYPFEKFGVRK